MTKPSIHTGANATPKLRRAATGSSAANTGASLKAAPKVGFVSLGCPKALVDSERIITKLRSEGYEIASNYDGADVVVVNTCGFLDSAKQESLDAIGEAMAENGRVIVTGCFGVEEGRIREAHPGVLAVTGPHQYEQVVEAVHGAVPPLHDPYVDLVPPEGLRLTPRHYAYLKVSEGCNNRCSFCIIPQLRGRLASRPAAHVMAEAERLVEAGVKELLASARTPPPTASTSIRRAPGGTSYSRRASSSGASAGLARRLGAAPLRLSYPHIDEVLTLMAEGKVLPYLDVPFQHASPAVLKAMRRPAHQEKTLERLGRWRQACPDLAIRSTFIVGFPGETEADFAFLLDWLGQAKLARVGCFKYEAVDGAAANDIAAAVPEEVKEERWPVHGAAGREPGLMAGKVGGRSR
jgi:ribosomal protein S12 methylthiotransferase